MMFSLVVVVGLFVLFLAIVRYFIRSGGSFYGLPTSPIHQQLVGKIAVVTGCTGSGIGFECAFGVAKMGAHVILASITKEEGELAKKSLLERFGGGVFEVMVLDYLDDVCVKNFAKQIKKPIHILINCAGICSTIGTCNCF